MRPLLIPLLALLCLAVPSSLKAQINAALGKPVTTQYSTSTSTAVYGAAYGAENLTDGNLTTFSHPAGMTSTTGFRYDINLGRSYVLDRLRIYNRNNCCPERLHNYRVSVLADNGSGVPVLPALWTAIVRPPPPVDNNSGQGGIDELVASAHPAGTFTGQWIRIENISGAAFTTQVAEVQAITYDCGTTQNVALCKAATFHNATGTVIPAYGGYPAPNIADGSPTTFSHADTVAAPGTPLNYYYQIDLGADTVLDRVVLYGRTDGCCQERLSNFRVALLADNAGAPGAQTWSAVLHADGSWPPTGGADTITANMGAGTFTGRFIRVINLSSIAYNPQIGEIEAYRPPVPVINYFTTDAGNITHGATPGLPAQATLSWNVTGASTLSINQGIGSVASPAGTRVVIPAGQTTYTLTATNISGSSTATVTIAVDAAQLAPRLNEIMAENDGSLDDEDGSQPDWIELFNPNAFTLGLAGAHLSDNLSNGVKWAFPAAASIPPNGFLLVFASNKDRAAAGSPLHTNFELKKAGETLSLYGPGDVLWSRMPADYPSTPTFPAQYRDTSYGVNGSGNLRFFRPSTPGAANAAAGYTAVVEDTSFSVKRGIYNVPQSVVISCLTPGAQIRYTTDGTKPTETTGTIYSAPISVGTTTVIRAAAYLAGAAPSNVDTHTYIFPASIASQPAMQPVVTGNATWGAQIPAALTDVPSIALTTPNTGAYNGDTEIESAFEWIHNTDPLEHTHANCGVQYFGGAFTPFAKKSFRLYFRGLYGDKKLKANLFGGHEHGHHAVQEFDSLEIRNGSHDMRARGFYMSNLFTDQVLMEQGQLAPHGRFVHVYLNGSYWGLYHLRERWNAAMHSSYLGGQKEDYEAINGNYNVGGWATPGTPFDGDGAAWEHAKTQRTNYKSLRGLIDVKNYTDYMITWMFGNSEDEWRGVSPNRLMGPGSGSRFILNDADGWLSVNSTNGVGAWDNNQDNTVRGTGLTWTAPTFVAGRGAGDGPGSLSSALFYTAGSDYRMLLADRIHFALFNDGPLTVARNQARLDTMCLAIQRAFIAESARWLGTAASPAQDQLRLPADPPGTGDSSNSDWEDAWAVSRNSWMPARTATVLAQFKAAGFYPALNAPVFSQNGGIFAAGFTLGMSVTGAPAGSTIFYTLNGTDPRLSGGAISPAALLYSANIPLVTNAFVRCRTRTSDGVWSALQERFFQLNTSSPCPAGAVVPSEIHFNPAGDDDAEFIELMNVSAGAVNLRGCRFTAGIDFAFSEYRDTLLAPGQRLVLVDSEFVHRARYGWDRSIDGIYFDNLNNGGEQITFACGATTVFDSTFDGAWSPLADSGGYSLTLIHPQSGLNLSDPNNWRASTTADGTPGTGDGGIAFSGSPNADTDNDGATTFLEYAAGTSDTDAAQFPVVAFEPSTDSGFSFIRAAAADDAVFIPEISADLATWISGPLNLKILTESIQPGGRIKIAVEPQPGVISGTSRYYARVRAVGR